MFSEGLANSNHQILRASVRPTELRVNRSIRPMRAIHRSENGGLSDLAPQILRTANYPLRSVHLNSYNCI